MEIRQGYGDRHLLDSIKGVAPLVLQVFAPLLHTLLSRPTCPNTVIPPLDLTQHQLLYNDRLQVRRMDGPGCRVRQGQHGLAGVRT